MPSRWPGYVAVVVVALTFGMIARSQNGVVQQPTPLPDPKALLEVPVSRIFLGGMAFHQQIKSPDAADPAAITRGMQAFNVMNCIGCHAPNGGGGMGPALSERTFIYGREPANIYLSIFQGRPNGMPAWGAVLPANSIWDLVAYIRSLSNSPETEWGQTTSLSPPSPSTQQVPAELMTTAEPWTHTEPFGNGRKP